MKLAKKCVVDTNVPKTANLALQSQEISDKELLKCALYCVDAVAHVIKYKGLVLDEGDEIFTEYRKNLSLKGQPGMGDRFVKWVNDHRFSLLPENRVTITATGDSYEEFPDSPGLSDFDPSDKKFIAVANAHPDKPPVLQATDSKWWGWKEALEGVGIGVCFLCKEYIQQKYHKKMAKKANG